MAPCQELDLVEIRSHELTRLHTLLARYFKDVKYPGQFSMATFQKVWEPLLASGAATIQVATYSGCAVGVVGTTHLRDMFNGEMTATIILLWVDPEVRGQGIGAALLDHAENEARLRGCSSVAHGHMFTVQKDGGQELFEKRGYSAIELHFRKNL